MDETDRNSIRYMIQNYRWVVVMGPYTISRGFWYRDDAEVYMKSCPPKLGPYTIEHRDTGGK